MEWRSIKAATFNAAGKHGIRADHECACPQTGHVCENGIEVLFAA
jgi:hypothetical protein